MYVKQYVLYTEILFLIKDEKLCYHFSEPNQLKNLDMFKEVYPS